LHELEDEDSSFEGAGEIFLLNFLLLYSFGWHHSLQSLGFGSCYEKKNLVHENQYGTGRKDGIV
jgi:hypothetical protein